MVHGHATSDYCNPVIEERTEMLYLRANSSLKTLYPVRYYEVGRYEIFLAYPHVGPKKFRNVASTILSKLIDS